MGLPAGADPEAGPLQLTRWDLGRRREVPRGVGVGVEGIAALA